MGIAGQNEFETTQRGFRSRDSTRHSATRPLQSSSLIENRVRSKTFSDPQSSSANESSTVEEAEASRKSIRDRDFIMLFSIVAVIIASFWFSQNPKEAVFAACVTSPPSLEFLPEQDVTMTVKSGSACAVWTRVTTIAIDSLYVETQPVHGTAGMRGRTGVIYRPDAGYVGKDSFAFVRAGTSQYHKGNSLVRVAINVE